MNKNLLSIVVGCFALFVFGASFALGQIGNVHVGIDEASNVANNWTSYCTQALNNRWSGSTNPSIEMAEYLIDAADTLAYVFQINPSGYVVIAKYQEITPIIAYSTTEYMDLKSEWGFCRVLRADLVKRNDLVKDFLAGRIILSDNANELPAIKINKEKWSIWSVDPADFEKHLLRLLTNAVLDIGPLLQSVWHQGIPYYNFCPIGNGGQRCVVGCVATATSQLMRYWQWPPYGAGNHSYWWSGDGSAPGQNLYADFSDSYDWQNILLNYSSGYNPSQANAVAELSYEVGVAYEMDYHVGGSGAYASYLQWILPLYFRYVDDISEESRPYYTADSWFIMLQNELNTNRPLLYCIYEAGWGGHAMVCDGWRVSGGNNQIHINYGWGGSYNNWYTIDNLYHGSQYYNDRAYRGIRPGDLTPPTPDPMTFASPPSATSPTAITMTATQATDDTPPIVYQFDFYSGGPGGTDRYWGTSLTYTDYGLTPNTEYNYRCRARDSASPPNETGYSAIAGAYTLANVPGAPELTNVTTTTIDLNINPNNNPIYTTFAIVCTTLDPVWHGKFVNASGNPSDPEVWQEDTQWGTITILGLNPETAYSFQVKAQNGDNIETEYGRQSTETTLPEASIPTLSEWGMIVMALLLLAVGTAAVIRRQKSAALSE